jgi:uncharacterized membrane protein YdjX (TVP38/TMEM64 family)
MWLLLMIMMFRELCMAMYGYILFSRYDRVYSSKWWGKICKVAMITVTSLLFLWHDIPRLTANIMIIACSCAVFAALFMYTRMYLQVVWGDDYGKNTSAVIRTVALSAWIIAMIVAIAMHDKISVRAILEYTPSNLILAAVVMLLLFGLKTLSVFFYSGFLFLANGTLFSLPAAIMMNIAGAMVMLLEGYFLGKTIAGPTVKDLEKKQPKLRGLIRLKDERPFLFVILLRLLKALSYDLGSMYLGASEIKLPQYIAGSLIGIMPDIILYAVIGRGLGNLSGVPAMWAGTVYIILSVISVVIIGKLSSDYNEEEGGEE